METSGLPRNTDNVFTKLHGLTFHKIVVIFRVLARVLIRRNTYTVLCRDSALKIISFVFFGWWVMKLRKAMWPGSLKIVVKL